MVRIVPVAPEHVEGFHRLFDSIARERRYLAAPEAPPRFTRIMMRRGENDARVVT